MTIEIKPLGNLLLSQCRNPRSSLGTLILLSDALLLHIVQSLDTRDLLIIGSGCKLLYALCRQEEIWKEKCKSFLELEFFRNWKSTYIKHFSGKQVLEASIDTRVYSDYLFTAVKSTIIGVDQLTRPDLDNIQRFSTLTPQEFLLRAKLPFILTQTDGFKDALEKWDLEYLRMEFGKVKFKAEDWELDFKNYIDYLNVVKEEAPLYLFDKGFGESTCLGADYTVPEIFNDYFQFMNEKRPDYRWLIVGPERSGSGFHKDPNGTSAWNIVIRGSKKWILFPPHVIPPGVFPSKDGSEVTSTQTLAEWFLNFYPQLQDSGLQYFEGVCKQGELMFVPSGWWHAVMNLETSIAITQNFVNEHNLSKVLEFIKCKDLVSGTNMKDLHAEFTSALSKYKPELLKSLNPKSSQVRDSIFGRKEASFHFTF